MMDKTTKPDISVVVLTQKTPLMILKRCLHSIHKQTLKNIEIILLDSNSKNSSHKLAIQSEPGLLENLTYLEIPEESEYICGKNTALNQCTGEYITFLSAEDHMPEKRLECVLSAFRSAEEETYDAIYTDMIKQESNMLEASDSAATEQEYQFLPQLIIQRRLLKKIGGFDTDLVSHADKEIWFRINSLLRVYHLSSIETLVSVTPDFYMHPKPLQDAIGCRQIAVKYTRYFKKHKKEKKKLYYQIAKEYKAASLLFRYMQFQIKAALIGNLSGTSKQNQQTLAVLQPETSAELAGTLEESFPSCQILTGKNPEQILDMVKSTIRHMKYMEDLSVGRIAKIAAGTLNEIELSSFRNQLQGNCLFVENAFHLQPATLSAIFSLQKTLENDLFVIFSVPKRKLKSFIKLLSGLEQTPHYDIIHVTE